MYKIKRPIYTMAAIWSLFMLAAGCIYFSQAEPKGGITPPQAAGADKNAVTLLVYGGWDYEADVKKEDHEFVLEDGQAQTIRSLFYHHEMQIEESPSLSAETFAFQIGGDRLGTSMGGLRTLSGRINGKLVTVKLSDLEYESVYQIVSQYTQYIPG